MSKRIPLTQGKFAIVDDEDYKRLLKHKWYANKIGNTFYAGRNIIIGNIRSSRNPKRKTGAILTHHQIMQVLPNILIDHRNGNGLDNQKCNLRISTRTQNSQNQRKISKGTSKYKGVSWSKQKRKWRARIVYNSQEISLGLFNDEIEAARIYDAKAKELFGEFAKTNF